MSQSQTNHTVQTVQIRAGGETVRYLDSRGAPPAAHLRAPRRSAGFWVRNGQIMSLVSTHVQAIIDNPPLFGLSAEEVHSAYKRHNERLGREGKARLDLIQQAARSGWVRVRHYGGRGRDYWSIGADKIERRRETINLFVRFALEQGFAHRLQEVIIVGYDDEQAERYLFNNGGLGAYADAFLQ